MREKTNKTILYLAIFAYIFYFGLISWIKFFSYGFHDFDLAVHALSMWNIAHGSIYNSILGVPFLGNHVNLILFLIYPLYAIFQHPLTILFLQTLALGLGALPLYFLARRMLGVNWGLLVALSYLFYPPLAYTNLFEFHPPALATFFLLMSIYYFESASFAKFMLFAGLSMFCQENVPLAVFMLGLLAFIRRRSLKWIIVPMVVSAVYFMVVILAMSAFNNNTIQFFSLYNSLGQTPREAILNILTHPGIIIKILFRKECFVYILQLFSPVLFLSFLAPLSLIPALPFFFQHMLSSRNTELSIFYHYSAEIIPFVYLSLIYGIKKALDNKLFSRPVILQVFLSAAIIISSFYFGPHFKVFSPILNEFRKDYLDNYRDKLVSDIPKDAAVVATFEFLPHLSNRKFLYSFHHIFSGYYTLSDKPYALGENARYALIDFNDPLTFGSFTTSNSHERLQDFLFKGKWQAVDFLDSIVYFRRSPEQGEAICGRFDDTSVKIANLSAIKIEDTLELLGYAVNSDSAGILDLKLYWKALKSTRRDLGIIIDFTDQNGGLLMRRVRPVCYRIFPTYSWKENDSFWERIRIKIPDHLASYSLKIAFFDYRTDQILLVDRQQDYLGRVNLMERYDGRN